MAEKKSNPIELVQNFFGKLSVKERRLFYIATAFIILAFFDRAILSVVNTRISDIETGIERERALIGDHLRLLAYKERVMEDIKAYQNYFSPKRSIQADEITILLEEMEKLGNKSPINLINVTPIEDIVATQSSTLYSVKLECSGPPGVMIDFLGKIDQIKKPIKIKSLKLTKPKPNQPELKGEIIVLMKVISAGEDSIMPEKSSDS